MNKWLQLTIGGVTGTFARYALSGLVYSLAGTNFPYGTLAVNLLGCFAIGIFLSLSEEKFLLGADARLLLMTGFCGAFTTFSTLILETANLLKDGETLRATANILLSLILGMLVFKAGVWLGESF